MSSSQTIAAGLIGLVVAGAGAVGVYNFTTTGCFLGSCSSGAGASQSAPAGLLVSQGDTQDAVQSQSCCPLTSSTEAQTTRIADSNADEASTLGDIAACDDAAVAENADECAGCGVAGTEETNVIGTPAPGDG